VHASAVFVPGFGPPAAAQHSCPQHIGRSYSNESHQNKKQWLVGAYGLLRVNVAQYTKATGLADLCQAKKQQQHPSCIVSVRQSRQHQRLPILLSTPHPNIPDATLSTFAAALPV